MISLINIISFFWVLRTIKFVLFWIYLWQLKNYHIGRFVDHFRTHHGKKIFFNSFYISKFVLLALLFVSPIFIYVALVVYMAESLLFAVNILRKNVRMPKITFKTVLLIFTSAILVALFLVKIYAIQNETWFAKTLLLFDILTPIIISFVVLAVQPFFVLGRYRMLQKATQKMAQFGLPAGGLKVVGITGSYGKTSTKEFLTTILSYKFNVLATPDHVNSEMGIAKTILTDLDKNHQIFIVEMGSYQKGGIKLLCDMVKPSMGIVTGVNQQHLATFGSLENLLSAEGGRELVKSLPKNALMVVNGDNKYCLDLYKNMYQLVGGIVRKKIYTVKRNKIDADIWTEDITVAKDHISFVAKSREKELASFTVSVLGKQHIQNLLGAMLVAKEFGMTFEEISKACANIVQDQAGMTLKTGIHGLSVIDASYSSNPDGVMADLDYLAIFPGKKVVVMPCLIELGPISAEVHRHIGKKIAEICDMAIITSKDKFKEIKQSAMQNGMAAEKILLCDKPQEILHHVTTFCQAGDAVLLEGRVPSFLISKLHVK